MTELNKKELAETFGGTETPEQKALRELMEQIQAAVSALQNIV